MEYLAVFDKQHSPGVACSADAVSHHQDRLTVFVDLLEKPEQIVGRPGIQGSRGLCIISTTYINPAGLLPSGCFFHVFQYLFYFSLI